MPNRVELITRMPDFTLNYPQVKVTGIRRPDIRHILNYSQVKVPGIDCALLSNGIEKQAPRITDVTGRAVNAFNGSLLNLNIASFIQEAERNSVETYCEEFKRVRGYLTQPLSQEEADFPIAYSIVVYKVCLLDSVNEI